MNESMNYEINRLLNFALQQGLIRESDVFYSANLPYHVPNTCPAAYITA